MFQKGNENSKLWTAGAWNKVIRERRGRLRPICLTQEWLQGGQSEPKKAKINNILPTKHKENKKEKVN